MAIRIRPDPVLRLLRRWRGRHVKGLCDRIYGKALASQGVAWVELGHVVWKLDLTEPTHRWLVYGGYEDAAVLRLIDRLPADATIVDSGANIGQMVVFYTKASRRRRVLAVEPGRDAAQWLAECCEANHLDSVSILKCGLGETEGSANLMAHEFSARRGSQNFISATGNQPIELHTLDHLAGERGLTAIDFWKLDTEGFELPALAGAKGLLAAQRIRYLWIEVAADFAPISAFLQKFGYTPRTIGSSGRTGKFDGHPGFSVLFAAEPPCS